MILFAKIWRKWSTWWKGYGLTYVCVCLMYLSVGCLVVNSLIACGSCVSSYNGFGSLTCCSVMSRFCWQYIWMYMFSQWFIFLLFLHGCISFRVSFAVPYSCLLFSICVAYAEAGLLVLMYLICSLWGNTVAQLVEALRYKSEGRGFDSRWCHWNFSLT